MVGGGRWKEGGEEGRDKFTLSCLCNCTLIIPRGSNSLTPSHLYVAYRLCINSCSNIHVFRIRKPPVIVEI